MINVVVVEDNDTIREGLKVLIDAADGFSCKGVYSECQSMMSEIKNHNPDVLLIDLILPGISGIEGIKLVKSLLPELSIIVLTVYSENDYIFDALCAGASGYITKNTPQSKLLYAIQEAYEGGTPMSSNIARKVISLFQQKGITDNSGGGKTVSLNQREQDILNKLVEGNSVKAIADSMFIDVDTLRSDFKNIYNKLHIFSKIENTFRSN